MSIDHVFSGLLIRLFTFPGAALYLSGSILASAILVLYTAWVRDVAPLRRALLRRVLAMSEQISAGTAERKRASFASNLEEVDRTMAARDPGSYVLQRAWLEYKQSFVQLEPGVIASSAPAGAFFNGAGVGGRAMEWWSNIFVAVGLMFTFLGIVAALGQATIAISSGQDAIAMRSALAGLLGVAAAKFWTSIAGVGTSLILRLYGRRWRTSLERLEDELCSLLDAGIRHISPQAVALRQLTELQELRLAISELLGAPKRDVNAPLVTSIVN